MKTSETVLHGTVFAIVALAGIVALAQPLGSLYAADAPAAAAAPPPPDPNPQDRLFVRQAVLNQRAETELARLAQKKGGAAPVRSFAKQVLDEQRQTDERLTSLGRSIDEPRPRELDPEWQERLRELERTAAGVQFDRAYLSTQIQSRQRAVNLLQYEISLGQNEQLKRYAAESLPQALVRLEDAQRALLKLSTGDRMAGEEERPASRIAAEP